MNIVLWTRPGDTYCREAVRYLQRANKQFVEKQIGNGYTIEQLIQSSPFATAEMPALFVDGKYAGGLREVYALVRSQ